MALSNREKRRQALIQDRRRILIEKSAEKRFKTEFQRMARQVGEDYRAGGLDRALVGMDVHKQKVRELLEKIYILSGKSAENYLKDFFGKACRLKIEKKDSLFDTDNTDLASVELMRLFRRTAFENSKLIAATSRETLIAITATLVETGVGEQTIGKEIARFVSTRNASRAPTIARTEVGSALMESQYNIVDELELPPMLKEWAATIDGRTRPDHKRVDGDTVKKEEKFRVGRDNMLYPQDRINGSAGQIINCRCVLLWTPADF